MSLIEKLDNSTIEFYSKVQNFFQNKFDVTRTKVTDYAFVLAGSGYMASVIQANSALEVIFPLFGAGVSAGFIANDKMRFSRGVSFLDDDLNRNLRLFYHSLAVYELGHVLKYGTMEVFADYFFDKPLENYISIEMFPHALGGVALGAALYLSVSENDSDNLER